MTNTTNTTKRVVELIELGRSKTTEAERNAVCWEIALAMQPAMRGSIRRKAEASEGSARLWRGSDRHDMEQDVSMTVVAAAKRLVEGKAKADRPVAYLGGAIKRGIADAQRTKTRDVMPASTKAGKLERGEKVVEASRADDVDCSTFPDERSSIDEPDPAELDKHRDERAAVALRIVQQSYPEATLETLSDFSAKILESKSRKAKALANARKLAPVGDVTPGEWLWDVEEAELHVASQPRHRLDEPVDTGTFVTLFGEEVAPPKQPSKQGKHAKKDRSHPGLWDDEQLPPPEQEGPDLGLAM